MKQNSLGDTIKARREKLGYSQRQLARALNVKPSHVGYLERGMRRPSLALLERIADVLGLEKPSLFLLAHPEARSLVNGTAAQKPGQRNSWRDFSSNTAMLTRYKVTPAELRVLSRVNLLGKVSSPRNFLFILQSIRQALEDE